MDPTPVILNYYTHRSLVSPSRGTNDGQIEAPVFHFFDSEDYFGTTNQR